MSALENIRKGLSNSSSTIIVGIIIVGLVATFGNFLGTDNAFSNQKVLEINGQDISIQEFSLEANRLNSIFSNQEIILEQDQVTQIAQDSIIQRILLAQQSDDSGFHVTQDFVRETIQTDPTFARDGAFNLDVFRGFLLRSGLGAEEFQSILSSQYKGIQLNEALNSSAFIPDDHLKKFISSINHHRDITFKKISLKEEANNETVTEEEIQNFYAMKGSQFIIVPTASFSIMDLNTNYLESKIQVSDSEVSAELLNLQKQNSNLGQKRISHIQIDFDNESKILSLQKVDDIKNQINSGMISFEEAASNFSDDLGSRDLDGDLGYTDGSIFPPEFEEEIKKLSLDKISSVVELNSSFHLIKLTENNEVIFTAKEARNSLIDQKTQSLFVSLEEDILNFIDQSKNLKEISKSVGVPLKTFSNTSLSESPEFLKEAENFLRSFNSLSVGEIIELPIDNDRLVFLEIEEFSSERQKTLEEAKIEISEILRLQKVQDNLNNLVDESILLFAQTNSSELTSYEDLKRDTSLLPNSMVLEIFSLRKDQVNQIRRFDALEGDTYVYTLDSIDEIELDSSAEELFQRNEFAKSAVINIEDSLFMEQLRSNASIKLGNLL